MGKISEELLKAINILIDKKISSLQFDRTVDGKIIDKTSNGYLVSVEGNQVNIPTFGYGEFNKNDTVKVCIPQNNIKNAYITVPLSDFGAALNKIDDNTTNAFTYSNKETLIGSYEGKQLYRRVFRADNMAIGATSWTIVGKMKPDLNVISMYGHFSDSIAYPLNMGSYHSRYVKSSGEVQFYNASSGTYTPVDIVIIVEYTK